MKIAIAQLNYTIGDIDGNTSKIIDAINRAKCRILLFGRETVGVFRLFRESPMGSDMKM